MNERVFETVTEPSADALATAATEDVDVGDSFGDALCGMRWTSAVAPDVSTVHAASELAFNRRPGAPLVWVLVVDGGA